MLDITVGCLIEYDESLVMVYEEQEGLDSWDIPAGHMEQSETPQQAVRREVLEETGIILTSKDKIDFSGVFYDKSAQKTTVHFLFKIKLTKKPQLRPTDTDIKSIALKNKNQIKSILTDKQYEHELAKKRLETYLYNDAKVTDFPLVQI